MFVILLIIIGLVVFGLYTIPYIITWWRLYEKAGQHGWAILIPVYDTVALAKGAGKPLWMGITVGLLNYAGLLFKPLDLVWLIFGLYLFSSFIKKFDQGFGFWALVIFLPIVAVFKVKDATYKGTPTPAAGGVIPDTPYPTQPNSPSGPVAPIAPTVPVTGAPAAPAPIAAEPVSQPAAPAPAPAPNEQRPLPPQSPNQN